MTSKTSPFFDVSRRNVSSPPGFRDSLFIENVPESAPAMGLGVERGDYLLSVNGAPARSADTRALLMQRKDLIYRIFQPRHNVILTCKSNGVPLGVRTSLSSVGIVKQYAETGYKSNFGFMTLWERKDYVSLKAAALKTKSLPVLGRSFLARKFGILPEVAKLMLAIIDFDNSAKGTPERYEAHGRIDDFRRFHSVKYTREIIGLCQFYQAIIESEGKDPEITHRKYLKRALKRLPDSERVRSFALRGGVAIDTSKSERPSHLKIQGNLLYLEGGEGLTTLDEILEKVPNGHVLPICVMAQYRGNGPYNAAMMTYHSVHKNVSDVLVPLLVITTKVSKEKDRPHWYTAEEQVFKENVPLSVVSTNLYKVTDEVNTFDIVKKYKITGAPAFFCVKKTGEIVSDQYLDEDCDYFEVIDRIRAQGSLPLE